ncbi:cupin-like domain-containing protein [Pseudonocardia sp. NPDC049635]|uniref:cupin-like domain-containing protein n=1 Tax=Pseudonocardia sp. NPDC049635 TaxID=3155506 RepID=UPI0033C72D42
MNAIFTDLDQRGADLWGTQPLRLRHSLGDLDLFSDESLASLIDTLPADQVMINTMAADGHDHGDWAYCDRAGLSGSRIIEAVRNGRLWINMVRLHRADSRFRDLLDRIYTEIDQRFPGPRATKQTLGLLVSSPGAQVYYHCDVPCQTLWQLRGRKRIWIYPPTAPFLRPAELEDVVRRVSEEDVTYETWFDEYAREYELTPGDMLHWPLNAPHRIVNQNVLNVSLTTEHWTFPSRRAYLVNFGNGVLRSRLGWRPRSRSTEGPGFLGKAALATVWRATGLRDREAAERRPTYIVDPSAPWGRRPVDSSHEEYAN